MKDMRYSACSVARSLCSVTSSQPLLFEQPDPERSTPARRSPIERKRSIYPFSKPEPDLEFVRYLQDYLRSVEPQLVMMDGYQITIDQHKEYMSQLFDAIKGIRGKKATEKRAEITRIVRANFIAKIAKESR